MAVRRMLHSRILGSDRFQEMPFGAQMLYVQITMACDDDGFFNGADRLRRFIGAKKSDLKLLIEKRFLLSFGDVVVVKHWRVANSLRNDRMKELSYEEIAKKIYIKPNRAYTDHPAEGLVSLYETRRAMLGAGNPAGIPEEEKGKEEKKKEEKREEAEERTASAAESRLKKIDGSLGKGVLLLTDAQTEDLLERMGLDGFDYYADKLSGFILKNGAKVKNHYETMLKWWKEDSSI